MSDDPFDLSNAPEAVPLSQRAAAKAAKPPYVAALNPEQGAAVEATDGPVLVLAGAGTGKTRVLTTRLAHILNMRLAFPGQILAVTFTNKAAREMRERIGGLIGGVVEGMPFLGTFHAIGARILRRHAELVGLKSNFTILDTDDQVRLIKQLLQAADIDDKRWPARVFASLIDRWKNKGLTPDKLTAKEAGNFADGKAQDLYTAYQARLRDLNAVDFGDLLLLNLSLFQDHPDVLEEYQRRFKYILVDEYQDTNVAQYLWLRLLAQGHKNICCVGDDDQSIYGWRGAEVGNILRFEEDFPGATIVRLERNYRSTGHILGAASGLIAANEDRLGKTLWTEDELGEPVTVEGMWDGDEEARRIGDEVEALQHKGEVLDQMAVLVRAGFQTRTFEERFLTLGIPYRIVGGARFYERAEIRDAMAYLRVMHQPSDDLAFERIVNKPRRGVGDATLQKLHQTARAKNLPLTEAARLMLDEGELKGKAKTALQELLAAFDRWRIQTETMPHPELTEMILDESGYMDMWRMDKSADAPGRIDNLLELVQAMAEFENLAGFLEHVSLVMENNETDDGAKISLMTLHAAKGLEFDTVFLPGWEEGLFPSQRTMDENGIAGLQEERRLAYVGITRARKRAHISFVANRLMHGSWISAIPSRFVDELPEKHVEVRGEGGGLYGGNDAMTTPQFSLGGDRFGSAYETPGWQRGQKFAENLPDKKNAIRPFGSSGPNEVTTLTTVSDNDVCPYDIGDRVFHQKFGYGRISRIDGNKLTIDFDKAGQKKVIDRFVEDAP